MAFFDLSLNELKTYCPDRDEPADFDAFWKSTLDEARAFPLNATFEKVDYGLVAQETFDVTFSGFGGQPIKGWLILPRQRSGKLPCVVEYIGYGGGRSFRLRLAPLGKRGLCSFRHGHARTGQHLVSRRYA